MEKDFILKEKEIFQGSSDTMNHWKVGITQEQYKTKYNSTFNMSYLSHFKSKEIKIDNSLSKNIYTNTNTNANVNNNEGNNNKDDKNNVDIKENSKGKKENKMNNNNCLLNIINKKGKKTVKRKENCLKLKVELNLVLYCS